MNFITPITILENPNPIDYNSKTVSLGSCFAVNIADKFEYFKFQNTVNPFGIIFNPVSMEKIIDRVVNNELFVANDLFFHNERWHCFEVHSDISHSNKEIVLESLNTTLKTTKQHLEKATHVIITYGTSWVYRNIENNSIVANCHKVPQKQFAKELLSVIAVQESIESTMRLIETINPDCNFIFTVSPVRHLKDGFIQNQWSKANLITAIHYTLGTEKGTNNYQKKTEYFPSYEIMMDELRDYRFYAEDMLHPSPLAVDHIWQRFVETTVAETTYSTMDVVETIQKSLLHRPFNPDSKSYQKFESNLRTKISKLVSQYSFMKF